MTATQSLTDFDPATARPVRQDSFDHLVTLIKEIGHPTIVCSRIPFGHQEVNELLAQPLVEGIVLESEDRDLMAAFPNRLGFYMKGGSNWQLPKKIAADMVYVGRRSNFGARVAWLAWRAGIRYVHLPAYGFQPAHRQHIMWVAVDQSINSILYRLSRSQLWRKLEEGRERSLTLSEFRYTRRLRAIKNRPLPIGGAPTDWQQGRIVIVGGTLGPGGAERQLTATMLGLLARGYRDMHFLHHSPMNKPNDFFLPLLVEAGIPFSQVDEVGGSTPVPSIIDAELVQRLAPLGELGDEIAAYAKEFVTRRPEIVHVWLDHMNVVAGLAALLVGVPRIILSCRSLSPAHFTLNRPYMRPIYRLLKNCPNLTFLNNSAAGAADYSRWLGARPLKKIQVVRNGFDFSGLPSLQEIPHLRCEYRRRLGIPEDAPLIGVIMRISEEKRPLLWIEIARQVAQRIPEAHFLIVGDGPMKDQVEATGLAALPGKIHFPGYERNATMAMAAKVSLEILNRSQLIQADWDALVRGSPDGWVFSLWGWQELILQVKRWSLTEYSFGVFGGGRLLAVVPLQYSPNSQTLLSSGWGGSGPVIAGGIVPKKRQVIIRFAIDHCKEIAKTCGASKICYSVSPVTRTSLAEQWGVNPFEMCGMRDCSRLTQVIDLSLHEDELWNNLSDLAKRKIRRAKDFGFSVEKSSWIENIDQYYEIHTETYLRTGEVPHPKEYFSGIAHNLSPDGYAVLWRAKNNEGQTLAFHNMARFNEGAYYHTGCSTTLAAESGANYLLFWEAMVGAKRMGGRWYDAGWIFPYDATKKQKGLTYFKTRFGGEVHRSFLAELDLALPEGKDLAIPPAPNFFKRIMGRIRGK